MTPSFLYEAACCGLRATESLLTANSIPVPAVSQVINHQPALTCCNALFVRLGPSRNVTVEHTNVTGLDAFIDPNPAACGFMVYQATFEVHLSRCVVIDNPLDGDCRADGDCLSVLDCATPAPVMPDDPCADPADKATETFWGYQERWLLETELPALWSQCLCEGWCGGGCSESFGCGHRLAWTDTEPFDQGGCAGAIARYELTWP